MRNRDTFVWRSVFVSLTVFSVHVCQCFGVCVIRSCDNTSTRVSLPRSMKLLEDFYTLTTTTSGVYLH